MNKEQAKFEGEMLEYHARKEIGHTLRRLLADSFRRGSLRSLVDDYLVNPEVQNWIVSNLNPATSFVGSRFRIAVHKGNLLYYGEEDSISVRLPFKFGDGLEKFNADENQLDYDTDEDEF